MVQFVKVELNEADLESVFSFKGDYLPHVLVNGISGSGKSTLLVNLILRYIEEGYTVIAREMGKFDFLSRFMKTSDIIAWLKSSHYTKNDKKERLQFWQDYHDVYGDDVLNVISHPDEIKEGRINILVYDLLKDCNSKEVLIRQYHEFLRLLRERRERNWEKESDVVIVLDEANHIMPTMSKNPYRGVSALIMEMTWWLAQWRGYHVRFVMSTHTTRQLHLDARIHCGSYFWKQSDRKDSRAIVQNELFHLEDDEFLEVYRRIQQLKPSQSLFIDDRREFKFLQVPWIPKKYNSDKIYVFIQSFKPRVLVKPLTRNWNSIKKVARELYESMTEKDKQCMFTVDGVDKSFFIDYVLSRDDLASLFGDNVMLDYLEKAMRIVHAKKDRSDDVILDIINAYRERVGDCDDYDLMSQYVAQILSIKPGISINQLASMFNVSYYRMQRVVAAADYSRAQKEMMT